MAKKVEVSVLSKVGCLPCIRVHRIVTEIKAELPSVEIREVEFTSEEGVALAVHNSVLYPPAVFINGALFAKGIVREEPLKEAVRKEARGE